MTQTVQSIKPVDILAIGVHPDDVELGCSGTLLKHLDRGDTVGILDLTRGELGTRGNADIRTKEAMSSAISMGATFRHQLQLADGFFQINEAALRQIITIVRACQPKIVLINAKADRHPDHGRASQLCSEALFLSGLRKIITTYHDKQQVAWRPHQVLSYIQDYARTPDIVIDISSYWDRKMALIHHFESQFYDPNSSEPQTPISSAEFLDSIRARALTYGRPIGCQYAEGFEFTRITGVSHLFELI